MNCNTLHIEQLHAMEIKQIRHCPHRQIGVVLMVYSVKLGSLDKIDQIWRFYGYDTSRCEQKLKPSDKTMNFGHMCKHMTTENHVSTAVAVGQHSGARFTEKIIERGNPG